MRLKKKILVGYGVAFVLMVLVVAWAVTNLVSLGKATDAILRDNYRSILAAENMVDALERQDSGLLIRYLGDWEEGTSQLQENDAVFLEWLARAKDNVTIEGEAELVQSIQEDYRRYRRELAQLSEPLNSAEASLESSLKTYQEAISPLFSRLKQACLQLRQINEENMYAASLRAGQVAEWAIWSTVLIAAPALMIGLIFSLVLAERIVRPLRRFMAASRKISAGDYAVQVPVETKDEFGRLAGEFTQMAARLARYHELNIEQIISEKNKSEAILSSIEDGLVVFDTDLKVNSINPAACRMLGRQPGERATLACADILPGPDVCGMIQQTIETGLQPDVPEEQRIVTLRGPEDSRHYIFSVTPVCGRDGRLTSIVLLLRDVTRLKEVERLKSEFVMAASHELRTPLTSVGMSIDLLLEHVAEQLDEKDRELLQTAHQEVSRMKALVSDLLDLSRLEAGRIELKMENVPVSTLFDHAVAAFKSQLRMKRVFLSVRLTNDVPPVRADANKITWILTNLISNALRYVSEEGKIQLTATRNGPVVHLSVRDDGLGIPIECQSKVFEKFVQVKGRESGGSGLGLAICKEIVRAHGGTIWVESSPGHGSTFTFTVPVAQ